MFVFLFLLKDIQKRSKKFHEKNLPICIGTMLADVAFSFSFLFIPLDIHYRNDLNDRLF